MKVFYAKDYGITPNTDISTKLTQMMEAVQHYSEEKTITFEPGTYYIDSYKCKKYMLYITNTVSDSEFSKDETPHLNAVPFYFKDIDNLTVDGKNSVFIIDGKVTNIVVTNCKNISIQNLEIQHLHPDMHELRVVKVTTFYVDFEMDKDSLYFFKKGKLYFYGKDYCEAADTNALNAHWIGRIRKNSPNKLQRVTHPLSGALKMSVPKSRILRAFYPNTFRFKMDDCFYLFDVRRQFAGIFVNQSKDIVLQNIKQRFNYSLALVLQDSENITVDSVEFAPEKQSARKLASVADFMQVCMCRGKISITNSLFEGAGDDCLNVHGVHFGIQSIHNNQMIVFFMHGQSHGYQPFHVDDTIAFINPTTLLQYGTAKITNAKLLNEYKIELTLDSKVNAHIGDVIEDVTACPDVYFAHNTLNRIITRGLLLTTRGKVVIEDNDFKSNSMSGILLSDDAKSWYESGMCKNVLIQHNLFDYCGETPILIKPENKIYKGPVHSNITIQNNIFKEYKGYCVYAKASENIRLKNNQYNSKKKIKVKDCSNVIVQ